MASFNKNGMLVGVELPVFEKPGRILTLYKLPSGYTRETRENFSFFTKMKSFCFLKYC